MSTKINKGELVEGKPKSLPCWTPNGNARYEDCLALFWCPKGHVSRVSPKVHSITKDGNCSPSYVCPHDGCFHEYVQFVDWGKE
jgi:hypothetical protein